MTLRMSSFIRLPCSRIAAVPTALAASSMTSSRLQNAKRTSDRTRSGSPLNTEVGIADDAGALGELAAERDAVVVAERAHVGVDEVGARRAQDRRSPRARGPAQMRSRLAFSSAARRAPCSSASASAARGGVLERRAAGEGHELLGAAHGAPPARPARTPSRSSSR